MSNRVIQMGRAAGVAAVLAAAGSVWAMGEQPVSAGGGAAPGVAVAEGGRVVERAEVARRMNLLATMSNRFIVSTHCYAPELTEAQFATLMARYMLLPPTMVPAPGEIAPQFAVDTTAWVGSGSQQASGRAQRASLTYSFVPDVTLWGNPNTARVESRLRADLELEFGTADVDRGRELIRQALGAWRRYAGLDYNEVGDSGIQSDFTLTRRSTVGDIRIGGFNLGDTGVLAYNFFPGSGGDMTINSFYWQTDNSAYRSPGSNYRYLRNVIAHEHGHGLGLVHQVPCNQTKLMEPQLSTSFDVLTVDDRRGGNRNYGDRFAGNQSNTAARDFGNLTTPALRSVIANDLSLNGPWSSTNPSGADWFRFTIDTAQTVTITAAPTGGSYQAGGQGSGCTASTAEPVVTLNATGAGDMNIELRNSAGTAILQTAASAGKGVSEVLTATNLQPGTYLVRVFDVDPITTGETANQWLQMYNLTIRTGTALASPYANAGVNKRINAGERCWFMGNINSAPTESGTTLTSFAWDFDNNGTFETPGGQVFRTYVSNGTYNATLRVTANNGTTGTDTILVTVVGATMSLDGVTPGVIQPGQTVPIVITGTNLRNAQRSQFTISGTGVSLVGTAVSDYFGTQVTGLSLQATASAPVGVRNLTLSNADGTATLTGAFEVAVSCPTVTQNPAGQSVNAGESASFTVIASGAGPLSYQWSRNGLPLSNDARVGGADSSTLTINPVSEGDAGVYSVTVSNACGSASSGTATLVVIPSGPTACSPADVVGVGGQPPADGLLTGDDFTAFINAFSSGGALADIVGVGGLPPGGDGITGDDFIAFINAFAGGCP